jgi:hypothetical protein
MAFLIGGQTMALLIESFQPLFRASEATLGGLPIFQHQLNQRQPSISNALVESSSNSVVFKSSNINSNNDNHQFLKALVESSSNKYTSNISFSPREQVK